MISVGLSRRRFLGVLGTGFMLAPVIRAMEEIPEPDCFRPLRLSYNSVPMDSPFVSLTFDDGPHESHTPRLLDTLRTFGVTATFYVIGTNVRAYPEIARRIVAEGHEIANHTWTHPSLSKLSSERVNTELERTHREVFDATGAQCLHMRPPYGAVNERVRKIAHEQLRYTTIMWSVDPMDWRYRDAARVSRELVAGAAPGAILLCHDIHGTTVDAIPSTLEQLLARGFQFVTVSELLAMECHTPPARPPADAADAADAAEA